jgi:thiamine kinase-like enzyme
LSTLAETARQRAEALPCWRGRVTAEPVPGGMSNRNFRVRDAGADFFVRIGEDIVEHNVSRLDEAAASRAAALAGIAPALVHCEPGAMVFRWIEGARMTPERLRDPAMLPRVAALLRRVHREVGRHLRGRTLAFWVFHALRDYAARLGERALLPTVEALEAAVQPVELVFGHNDLIAGNIIDDGTRLWLIDWEYAGYNTPLFDLAGLASNSDFDAVLAAELLALYYGRRPDAGLERRFAAMTAASLLREVLWSRVAERESTIEFDFAAYTRANEAKLAAALARWESLRPRATSPAPR